MKTNKQKYNTLTMEISKTVLKLCLFIDEKGKRQYTVFHFSWGDVNASKGCMHARVGAPATF